MPTPTAVVTTRFAPSPTGFLHIGGARTALFSWLHARRWGGRFLLRVEDTDRDRSTEEAVNAIFEGLNWLGLTSDETPVFQTNRTERYRELIRKLVEEGHAYPCYATREELEAMRAEQAARKEKPRYDGRWRPETGKTLPSPPAGKAPVIRFRNPQSGSVVFDDLIRGQITFGNGELDDLIIARADGSPTYNFCVVVDDMDMGVTHVIRGDDHVNNTPRQINILSALGGRPPLYAHVPMILGADGVKLSKRHGAVSVIEYRDLGFLPEAMLNYLVRLGWSHGDDEIFTREQMIELFDISRVQKSPARFDMEKAIWVNHQYLKSVNPESIQSEFEWHLRRIGVEPAEGPSLSVVIEAQRERCKTLVEMAEKSRFFYTEPSTYEERDADRHLGLSGCQVLADLRKRLQAIQSWDTSELHAVINGYAQEKSLGLGKVAQPLRVALAGAAVSPPIDQTLALVGRERTLSRIDRALAHQAARRLKPL